MVDITRPEYGTVWASEGEKLSPTQDKMELGWVQEMMPFQWENFLQARQDEAITYLLQKGIPEYSATQEYIAQKSVVLYQGAVYLATQTVTGVLPFVSESWKRVSTISDSAGVVAIAGGGTGATTAAQARTNLGLGTAATLDASVVVQKDENGNFSAGVITASLAGNASTADTLRTPRQIRLVGAVTSTPSGFDGSANVDISVTGVNADTLDSGTVPATRLGNAVVKTSATGVAKIPKGSASERPASPEFADFRGNTTTSLLEYFNGTSWVNPQAYSSEYVLNRANHTGTQTASTIVGLTDWQANPTGVQSLNGGQLAGFRNRIINGDMRIAQRGTSFALSTSSYTLDRFQYAIATTSAVVTVSQQADAPSDNEFQSSLRVAVTTADTSIAAGGLAFINHAIEGYNVRDLIGKTFILSFRVRSSKTGVHCVSFRNSGSNRSYVVEYTINAANTWESKTISLPSGLITAGTWDWANGVGLRVQWILAAGSTPQTTANAWQTGSFSATANQVNCLDTIGNIFAITGVQLEAGDTATPFEHRPYGAELALCQRYYEKAYPLEVAPGSVYGSSTPAQAHGLKIYTSTSRAMGTQQFKVTKRVSPTVRYWDQGGNLATFTVGDANGSQNTNAFTGDAFRSVYADTVSVSATVDGTSRISPFTAFCYWDASAEL